MMLIAAGLQAQMKSLSLPGESVCKIRIAEIKGEPNLLTGQRAEQ